MTLIVENGTDSTTSGNNVVGAVIFFSYICTALGLTGLIVADLIKAYIVTPVKSRHASNHLLIFGSFAVLSFSVLSYHMLNVLIYSYAAWTRRTGNVAPQALLASLGASISDPKAWLQIWIWAKSSTLFRDFAEVICNDPVRFWWTLQALSFSVAWNTFMAVEGSRRGVPRLWAYFFLNQILPVSFSQNLFVLALILVPPSKTEREFHAADSKLQVGILLVYFWCVSEAPAAVGTTTFFPLLFAIRALLFAPLPVLAPSPESSWRTPRDSRPRQDTTYATYRPAWIVVSICAMALLVRQSKTILDDKYKSAIWEGFRTINEVPAVSTLAYDYLVGMTSLYVFWATW